ncbi:MAG: PA2779 family protein [Hyphomicrobiales bacterium]
MIAARRKGQPVFFLMITLALLISIPYQPALAALIGTETAMNSANGADVRERLQQYLAREDVRAALLAQGIDPSEAQARIESLTDSELAQIAGQFDKLPAAGDGLGLVIAVLIIILLVIVILKVAGKL